MAHSQSATVLCGAMAAPRCLRGGGASDVMFGPVERASESHAASSGCRLERREAEKGGSAGRILNSGLRENAPDLTLAYRGALGVCTGVIERTTTMKWFRDEKEEQHARVHKLFKSEVRAERALHVACGCWLVHAVFARMLQRWRSVAHARSH